MTLPAAWQTMFFISVSTGMSLIWVLYRPGMEAQALLLAPMVVVLGLPHGALDMSIAQRLWPLDTMRRTALFIGLYVGIAAAVGGIWLVLPSVALAAFLIYSAWHFSDDWADAPVMFRITGGIGAVTAPALFHQAEVATLFAYLAPASASRILAAGAWGLGLATLAVFVAVLLTQSARRGRSALEQAAIWALAAILPPLLYFVCYFCLLHSIRHFDTAMGKVGDRRRAIKTAIALSVLTLLGAAGLTYVLVGAEQTGTSLIVKPVFIGLAALTVPHMLLIDRMREQR